MNQQFQIDDIILASGLSIKLRNTIQFKHGQDGFHLWEAGIVLTRYVYYNIMPSKQIFMDLGTGVGIAGILISKYTRVIMTDYNQDVLDNAWLNVKLNQSPCIIMQLDWRNHNKISFQVDLIVGSDLVYSGAPLYDLYQTIVKLLKQNGIFYLIIPNNRMCTTEFIDIMNSEGLFEIRKELLEDEKYYQPCLLDPEQSHLLYPGLKELKFYMYIFIKK